MTDQGVPRSLRIASEASWRLLVIAGAVVVTLLLLVKLRIVVVPVILALLLTTVLAPPARWLRDRGVPNLLATLAVLAGALLTVAGLVLTVVPAFVRELDDVGVEARAGFQRVVEWIVAGPFGVTEGDIQRWLDVGIARLGENSSVLTSGVVSGALLLVELVAGLLLTAVLLFFFVKDGERIWDGLVDLLPRARRADADELGRRAFKTLQGYVRGVAVIAVVDAVLVAIVLLLVGVPLVVPLAVLTFLGAFLPIVGAFAAGLLAALVALVANGVVAAIVVVVAIIVIQQLEGDLLYPLVVGKAVRLHPVAILLALTTGAVLGGVIGAFVAVPAAAVLSTAIGFVRERSEGKRDYTARLGRRAPA